MNRFEGLKGRELEDAVDYNLFYRPKDGFVGDVIPYYENGIFYIFYLKDQGNSYNHSIFLVETKDFLHYIDKGEVIHASENKMGQDDWAGTGSVVKVDNTYYFFYTGHNHRLEIQEKIMIAKSENDIYHFKKIENLYIEPLEDLSHIDFRDPDVFYDAKNEKFTLTITTNSPSKGKIIAKYSLSKNLKSYSYDGVVFQEKNDYFDFKFFNFECSDIFKINRYWYLSFSCQDDALWVTKSKDRFTDFDSGKYGTPYRLDGKYFYVPKSVSDGVNTYMVGWARGRRGCNDNGDGTWGGNLLVSKVVQKEDGTLYLTKINNLDSYFQTDIKLSCSNCNIDKNSIVEISKIYGSFKLEGDIEFTGKSDFGFIFGSEKNENLQGKIKFNTKNNRVEYIILNKNRNDSFINAELKEDAKYHFTLVSEGSVVVIYIDEVMSLTCRFYEIINSHLSFYSKNTKVKLSNLTFKIR